MERSLGCDLGMTHSPWSPTQQDRGRLSIAWLTVLHTALTRYRPNRGGAVNQDWRAVCWHCSIWRAPARGPAARD